MMNLSENAIVLFKQTFIGFINLYIHTLGLIKQYTVVVDVVCNLGDLDEETLVCSITQPRHKERGRRDDRQTDGETDLLI